MTLLAKARHYLAGAGRAPSVLGVTQIVHWGITFYAITVLAQPIADETGWSKTLIFGAYSWALLVAGLASTTVGGWSDRHPPQRVMGIGSGICAAGLLALAHARDPIVYVAAWTVIGLAMRMTLYEAAFATLAKLSGRRARRAISELTLWGGFASTVFWPVGHALEQAIGWRETLVVYAGLAALVCLPLHAFLLPRPSDAGGNGDTAGTTPEAPPLVPPEARALAFTMFAVALSLYAFVFSALSAHFVTLLSGLGLAVSAAVAVSALKGPAQVAARFVEMVFLQRLPPLLLGVLTAALLPVSFFFLWSDNLAFAAAAVFALVYGAANGLNTIVRGALPLTLFGRDGYGRMIGRLGAPFLVVSALAPTLFAYILETGGPRAGLAAALVAALLSLATMAMLAFRFRKR